VPELERLVADHPLRERLVAALMLALYRAGRQADALAAFQAARGRMVDELGLEPGPEVRELEQRILRHDPALATPRRSVHPRRPRARVLQFAAVALILGTALTAGMVFSSSAAHAGHTALAGANGIVAVDTGPGRLVTAAPLAGAPEAVGSGAGSVWAAEPGAGVITRIDPVTGAVMDQVLVGAPPRLRPVRGRCGSPTSTPAPSPGSTRAASRSWPASVSVAARRRSPWAGVGCGWALRRPAAATAAGRW
jgi:Bacterial transcriptional activator domain